MYTGGRVQYQIRDVQGAYLPGAMADDDREQLVVTQASRTKPVEFFTRPVVWSNRFHRTIAVATRSAVSAIRIVETSPSPVGTNAKKAKNRGRTAAR